MLKFLQQKMLLSIAMCLIVCSAFAKASYWTDVPVSSVNKTNSTSKVYPEKFRTLTLNYEAMKTYLMGAPKSEVQNLNKMASIVVDIPMPYGSMESFRVIETPMMEEGLANKYPTIKTYTGVSISNPSNTLKMDIGPFGFHAMVLSNEGRYFVDPISNFTTTEYMSYYRRDLPTWANTFNCSTVADEQFLAETKTRLENYYQRGAAAEIQMRTYRLALACTMEYSIAATGMGSPSKAQVLAKMVTSMNRVNGVYEKDVAVHMNLVENNDTLIFLPGGTDPYDNNNGGAMLSQNVTTINARIGLANYDIGHVFSTGGGGVAGLGVVCTSNKARGVTGSPSPVGDAFDIDYVAHEMGHQFAGNHTFNSVTGSCAGGNRNGSTAYEPGSGTTIMAYAGICGADNIASNSDPYFHAGSLDEINAFINSGAGNNCPVKTMSGNNPPVVEPLTDYTIPLSTPFRLEGSASDPDGDVLTYSWEQMDIGPGGAPNSPTGNAPLFRFYPPKSEPVRIFPKLNDILTNTQVKGERLPNYGRTMKFRLTARDNKVTGGGTGKAEMTITVSAAAGPFTVSNFNTLDTMYVGANELITWNVANTDAAPVNCSLVRILLSTDGGQTFPIILKDSTANDGFESVVVPDNVTSNARIKVEAIGNIFFDINNSAIRILAPLAPDFNVAAVNTVPQGVCPPDSISFDISVNSILGFNDPVVLSATNLPVGAGVNFSKSPVLPGETVTMKVSTQGLTSGTKNLTVVGTSGVIVRNAPASFNVVAPLTGSPSISSPANGQINVNPNNPFVWSSVTNATGYILQIGINSSFDTLVLDTTIIGNGSVTYVPVGLPHSTKLYTRVFPLNPCGSGTPSAVISFTTGSLPNAPSNLMLLSQSATSATLKWTDNANNETGFRVERSIDNDTSFTEVASSLLQNTTIYISPNLVDGTTYYYRVRAVNGIGYSDYSNTLQVVFRVGVNSNKAFQSFEIFPNPSENIFNIEIADEYRGNMSIAVIDEMGRVIYSDRIEKLDEVIKSKIDMTNFANGVYLIKVNSSEKSVTKRIVKIN